MNFIARRIFTPYRPTYPVSELGYASFKLDEETYMRIDGEFKSSRNKEICYSVFAQANEHNGKKQCLVMLTGNTGDRRSVLFLKPHILPNEIDVACFDYNGTGCSERDALSYTVFERQDLRLLVI